MQDDYPSRWGPVKRPFAPPLGCSGMGICGRRRRVIQKIHRETRSQLSPVLHCPRPSHSMEALLNPVHTKEVCLWAQAGPYLSTSPPALSSVQWPTNRQEGRAEPIKETPVIYHLLMDRQLMMILWWLLSIEWITFWPVLLSHFHCTLNSVCHVRPSILSEPLTQFSRAAALAQLPHFVSGAL